MTRGYDPTSGRGMIDALLTTIDKGDALILSPRRSDFSQIHHKIRAALKYHGLVEDYRVCFRTGPEGVVAWMERRPRT